MKKRGVKANSRFDFENKFINMPKSKRSQSELITTVLIILLVLAAIVVVWNVVNITIKKSSSEVSVNQFALKGEIKYYLSKIENQNDAINVSVHRGSGGGNITGVKLIFEFTGETTRSYENRIDYPKELETKVYTITGGMLNPATPPILNFLTLKKVSVHYIFSENNKDKFTMELDSAEKPSVESASGGNMPPSCTDNDGDHHGIGSGCLGSDCNDGDINIWMNMTLYADGDKDGYGIGGAIISCTNGTVPYGFSTVNTDCNDTNNKVWKNWVSVYNDSDRDGYGIGSAVTICGNNTLHLGYATAMGDCNDSNPSLNPGVTEIRNDGIDQDCDGYDNLNECGTLSVAGAKYILDNDLWVLINQSTCFNINANNAILDLNGHIVEGETKRNEYCSIPCYNYNNQTSCNSNNICSWNTPYQYCDLKCSNYSNQTSCESNNICKWSSGYCGGSCYNYNNQTSCESDSMCAWTSMGIGWCNFKCQNYSDSASCESNNICDWFIAGDYFTPDYGIQVSYNKINNIIKNGKIKNFYMGIYLNSNSYSNFTNLNISLDVPRYAFGAYFSSSNNNKFNRVSVCGSGYTNIFGGGYSFYSGSSNNNAYSSNTCNSSLIGGYSSNPMPTCQYQC